MKRRLLLPALFSLLTAGGVWGADVYFYHQSTGNPVNRMTDAHKLVFNDSSTDAFGHDGSKATVSHADFDYILFRAKSESAGTGAVSAEATTEIRCDGHTIAVTSSEYIDEISVTDVAGRETARFNPSATSFTIPAGTAGAGVAIVKVLSGNQLTVSKVIIK